MKLTIQSATNIEREELRTLLIDDAETLAGAGAKVLEARLAWEGYPILLVDAQLHPVLVSFDTTSAQTALHNGLQAVEQLVSALPWVNQVYGNLQGQKLAPRLVIVSHELPHGGNAILANCPQLDLFRYNVLSVNGETGLWLEAVSKSASSLHPDCIDNNPLEKKESRPVKESEQVRLAPVSSLVKDKLPALSEEENSYFQQL